MILLSKEGNTNKSTTTITQSFWAEDCELLDLETAAGSTREMMLWCNTWEGIPGRWVPGPLGGCSDPGSESLIGDRTKYGLGHFVLNILERDGLAIKRPGTVA